MTVTLAAGLTPPAEFLADHTFRTVLVGTTVIGVVAGALGTFAYLRRQSLLADAISHSALPGLLVAFLAATMLGLNGRNPLALVVGSVLSGVLAVAIINALVRRTPLRPDAAMAAMPLRNAERSSNVIVSPRFARSEATRYSTSRAMLPNATQIATGSFSAPVSAA